MDAGRALLQEAKSKVIAKKVVTGPMMDEVRNKLQFWYYIQWRILHLHKSRVKTMNSQADDKTLLN